jgi:hypothetical protein
MAISNAERQARYRENKRLGSKEQELGGKRLDCWLSTEAFLALGRLSRHQGESKQASSPGVSDPGGRLGPAGGSGYRRGA